MTMEAIQNNIYPEEILRNGVKCHLIRMTFRIDDHSVERYSLYNFVGIPDTDSPDTIGLTQFSPMTINH